MSMMGYLAAVTPAQIAAFRARPDLAGDYAEIAVLDAMTAERNAALALMPADARRRLEAQYKAMMEAMSRAPGVREQLRRQDAARPSVERLGPWTPILALHKTWNVLHYLITGHGAWGGTPGDALLGGAPIGRDLGYGPPRLHDPAHTRAFGDALAPLTPQRLAARIDWRRMIAQRVYPLDTVPDGDDAEMWREEIDRSFLALKTYVARAAEHGQGLLIWIG